MCWPGSRWRCSSKEIGKDHAPEKCQASTTHSIHTNRAVVMLNFDPVYVIYVLAGLSVALLVEGDRKRSCARKMSGEHNSFNPHQPCRSHAQFRPRLCDLCAGRALGGAARRRRSEKIMRQKNVRRAQLIQSTPTVP